MADISQSYFRLSTQDVANESDGGEHFRSYFEEMLAHSKVEITSIFFARPLDLTNITRLDP
jgi:hypothetical protein